MYNQRSFFHGKLPLHSFQKGAYKTFFSFKIQNLTFLFRDKKVPESAKKGQILLKVLAILGVRDKE